MQLIFEGNGRRIYRDEAQDFGSKIGLFAAIFGCWHKNLSRPFTHGRNSYIVCLNCGARKHFDTDSLKTSGSFCFPPDVSNSKT